MKILLFILLTYSLAFGQGFAPPKTTIPQPLQTIKYGIDTTLIINVDSTLNNIVRVKTDSTNEILTRIENKPNGGADTTHTAVLQQIANNTAEIGVPQFEIKEWRMMFNDQYTNHNITTGQYFNQLYVNNLSTMQDVGDRTFRNSDGTPYVIFASITYDIDGNQFNEWQSFDAGVTTYNLKNAKIIEITFFVIKDHNSHLDSNGGISEIKAFPTYTNGELTSTIYVNVKLIRDVKE